MNLPLTPLDLAPRCQHTSQTVYALKGATLISAQSELLEHIDYEEPVDLKRFAEMWGTCALKFSRSPRDFWEGIPYREGETL